MDSTAQKLLQAIYQQSSNGDVQIRYSSDKETKIEERAAIQQLVDQGLIIKVTSDLGGVICRLTSSGEACAQTL